MQLSSITTVCLVGDVLILHFLSEKITHQWFIFRTRSYDHNYETSVWFKFKLVLQVGKYP